MKKVSNYQIPLRELASWPSNALELMSMLKARAHANVSQECAEEIAAAEVANAGGDGAGELVAK